MKNTKNFMFFVVFEIVAETSPGEVVAITGDQHRFGYWEKFLYLSTSSEMYPLWRSEPIEMPQNCKLEFKAVITPVELTPRWEAGPNRTVLISDHGRCISTWSVAGTVLEADHSVCPVLVPLRSEDQTSDVSEEDVVETLNSSVAIGSPEEVKLEVGNHEEDSLSREFPESNDCYLECRKEPKAWVSRVHRGIVAMCGSEPIITPPETPRI